MIVITNIDDKYFELDGIRYAKIYQPLAQGSEGIGIYNHFDTRQQLQHSTKFDEYEIDGSTYGTQALTIAAILDVVYSQGVVQFITENNPDEEDITVVDEKLKFKDRAVVGSRLGYRIIRADFDFTSIPSEYGNSIWEIRYSHDLGNNDITLPSNVKLYFNGGLLTNYNSISGDNTEIVSRLYKIFDNSGSLNGTWSNDVVFPEWFGALGDGLTDDTNSIQTALSINNIVVFRNVTYKIEGTLNLKDNKHLKGKYGTIFKGIMTVEGGGGFPNQMFINDDIVGGNENIIFEKIKFDFSKGAFNYVSGVGLTSINSLKFIKVNNLQFNECDFFDFVTNYNTSLTGKDLLNFGMSQFNECENISFKNIKSSNIREEGFNFYQCKQVDFNVWSADGSVVNTSSHAAFWYCEGVNVKQGNFIHTGGSVLNCYSRNVLYENIIVNYNQTQAGKGFDFGNELDAISYEIGNIKVNNCYLNVTDYGVQMQSSSDNDECESMIISNNVIIVSKGIDNRLIGVSLRSSISGMIQNNYIYLSDADVDGIGQCIALAINSDASVDTIEVSNNRMRGLTGVFIQQNNNCEINNLNIFGNKFTSQNIGSLSSYSGASTFFYVRNNTSAVNYMKINNIKIFYNKCENIGGACVSFILDKPEVVELSSVFVCENEFIGVTANMDRGFSFNAGTVPGRRAILTFNRNIIENNAQVVIQNFKKIVIESNMLEWVNAYANNRFNVINHDGDFDFRHNRMINVNSSYFDVKNTSGTYRIINIDGNFSQNTALIIVFGTDMPANTTI